MWLARLVITAVTVEGRYKSAVAREYGVTRFWVQTPGQTLRGPRARPRFEPRSRRPHSRPPRGGAGG